MAKVCEICMRSAIIGNSRSHSKIATRRRMNINLQSKKIGNRRVSICTSCLRTVNKLRQTK